MIDYFAFDFIMQVDEITVRELARRVTARVLIVVVKHLLTTTLALCQMCLLSSWKDLYLSNKVTFAKTTTTQQVLNRLFYVHSMFSFLTKKERGGLNPPAYFGNPSAMLSSGEERNSEIPPDVVDITSVKNLFR
ncbi:hypothetical protein ABKN59_005900 [Abortiporus biennis]